MKKLSLFAAATMLVLSSASFAQTTTSNMQVINGGSTSPMAGGIAGALRPTRTTRPSMTNSGSTMPNTNNYQFKSLKERQQEQIQRQQQDLAKSGIKIENIQSTQQGTLNINPSTTNATQQMQSAPQMQNIQPQNAPVSQHFVAPQLNRSNGY